MSDEQQEGLVGVVRLSDLVKLTFKHWRVVVFTTALFGVLGTAYALSATQYYRSEVLMAPSSVNNGGLDIGSASGQLDIVSSFLSGGSVSGSNSDQLVAFLLSRTLAERFIRDQDLLPVLFSDSWDSNKSVWTIDPAPTMADGYKLFNEKLRRVDSSLEGGLLILTIDWEDPEISARWANEFVALANKTLRDIAVEEASRNMVYLREELVSTNVVEVRNAIFALLEQQLRRRMLANVQNEYAFKIIDPAYPSEREDFVRPNRPLAISLSLMFGLLVGLVIVLLRHRF